MKHFRNFLAFWSGGLLLVFAIAEFIVGIEAVVVNAPAAFELATAWWVVVIAMIIALLLTVLIAVCRMKKK